MISKQELIDFENDIADTFNRGLIKAPIHLYSGNEDDLIRIFHSIQKDDWVFCTWRSHYQCLLKGVPKDVLKKEIIDGHSISLNFPEYKVMSSAIVGGNIPIALGTALSIKRRNGRELVWCFVGDMGAETGAFSEAQKYAENHHLPIIFVVEDNGKSVCTDVLKTWGRLTDWTTKNNVMYYKYELKWPHAGSGKRIQF